MRHTNQHNIILGFISLVALAFAVWIGAEWYWWAAAVAIHYYHFLVTGFFIHRYHVHRAFTMKRGFGFAPYLAALSGVLWASDTPISSFDHHTLHHRFADTNDDPHGPERVGWLMLIGSWGKYRPSVSAARVAVKIHRSNPWVEDRFYQALDKYFMLIVAVWWAVLACMGWECLVFIGILPAASLVWSVNFLNFITHTPNTGYADNKTEAAGHTQNVPWLFPLVLGDAWHNSHHAKQRRTRLGGDRWWEFDPATTLWSPFINEGVPNETA